MRSLTKSRLALCVALVAGACSDPTSVVVDGTLEVVTDDGSFLVINHSHAFPLVVAIIEQETSTLVDLAPCELWTGGIPARGELRVTYPEVMGYSPKAETAVIYWCLLDGERAVDGGSLRLPFA
jgi:hypothetical protein